MYEIKCNICNKQLSSEYKGHELSKLGRHLKYYHNITSLEYTLNTNDIHHPQCACGCGNKVKFKKWKFDKYFGDHKNSITGEYIYIDKRNSKIKYKDLGLTMEDLKESLRLYGTPEFNSDKLTKKFGVDHRVLRRYWINNGLTCKAEMTRLGKLHKNKWGNIKEKNGMFQKIDEEVLGDVYDFLKKRNRKDVTYSFIKNMFGIKNSTNVIRKRLFERFGKDNIQQYVNLGIKSHAEVNFGYVLKYYFGNKIVKEQFRLKKYIYDFIVLDKLIIEYDGSYWHSSVKAMKNDKMKDRIAIENGYIIFRVDEKKSKSIDILKEIEKIIKKVKNNEI